MRIIVIVLLSVFLMTGCENPMEPASESSSYMGKMVQDTEAPFLLNNGNLAKISDGFVVISEHSAEGTVFGSQDNDVVYAAKGGEILPTNTWIGTQNASAYQFEVAPKVVVRFKVLTTVNLIGADNVTYLDENGQEVLFSGDGTIVTSAISTKKSSASKLGKTSTQIGVVIVADVECKIGGDGGEIG
ncbi:MAG: hypothetical protein K9N35_01055 [Candidatus Marinimicrobia bacterium]|nr:hypothetical protein [Candidatus Neomarinimicrobiota bacterium]